MTVGTSGLAPAVRALFAPAAAEVRCQAPAARDERDPSRVRLELPARARCVCDVADESRPRAAYQVERRRQPDHIDPRFAREAGFEPVPPWPVHLRRRRGSHSCASCAAAIRRRRLRAVDRPAQRPRRARRGAADRPLANRANRLRCVIRAGCRTVLDEGRRRSRRVACGSRTEDMLAACASSARGRSRRRGARRGRGARAVEAHQPLDPFPTRPRSRAPAGQWVFTRLGAPAPPSSSLRWSWTRSSRGPGIAGRAGSTICGEDKGGGKPTRRVVLHGRQRLRRYRRGS